MKISTSLVSACAALLAQGWVAGPAHAQKDGDLWEVTSEMSMPGMPAGMQMPGSAPRQVCTRRNDNRPPVADTDQRCEMYDVRRGASSVSWKMRCQGGMTGNGDITYEGRDRYRGTIAMDQGGQQMTIKLAGRRIGECDAAAQQAQINQQVAAVQRQSEQAMEQACAGAVQQLSSQMLRPESPYKCGPKYRTEFCNRLQTTEGFSIVAQRRRQGQPQLAGVSFGDLQEGAEFCGVSGDDIRERLCRRAEQAESLDFLGKSCVGQGKPPYGQAIVARECAGRTFSAPPAEKYRQFCSDAHRQGLMQQTADSGKKGAAAPAKSAEAKPEEKTEQTPQESAVDTGKRLLKGIFGR